MGWLRIMFSVLKIQGKQLRFLENKKMFSLQLRFSWMVHVITINIKEEILLATNK